MMPRDALQALPGFSRERILIGSLPRPLLLICPETQLYCLAQISNITDYYTVKIIIIIIK